MDLSALKDNEIVTLYGEVINELRNRNIVRSKNILGDLGEYMVINRYCNTRGLPKLQAAPPGTENIDAISVKGERYSIKSITSNRTSAFYGLNSKDCNDDQKKLFEYVIIAIFDQDYKLLRINELTWDELIQYKRWDSRQRAWNLTITRELLNKTRTVFINDKRQ